MSTDVNDMPRRLCLFAASMIGSLLLVACSGDDDTDDPNRADPLDTLGPVVNSRYAGGNDGLLGGFGLNGLRAPPDSFYADPDTPTPDELRRHAIHNNYTALIDVSADGGFGTLYGLRDDTRFPGTEYLAYIGLDINRAALMVQVPDRFDSRTACIVVVPSSGSRGVYGGVGTGGEFGLQKGCAVAYTDANKGTGAVALSNRTGYSLQLSAIDLESTTDEASFRVPTSANADASLPDYAGIALPDPSAVTAFQTSWPDRFAFKQAHSQKNVEKDWGLHTIQSVEFAFRMLNENHGGPYTRANTLVIGASVSNGGSALLRAAEQADANLFDGIVVGEPNIAPPSPPVPVRIAMGDRPVVTDPGRPAYDYFLAAELYAACASRAPEVAGALFAERHGDTRARCQALANAGLISGDTPEAQAQAALTRLREAGYLPESDRIVVGYAGIDLFQSLVATYFNAYTRSSVVDHLCNISMAYVNVADGELAPSAHPDLATLAARSSGIPRTADVYLIKDDAPDGPTLQSAAVSADSGAADYNLEGARCWQDIVENEANPLHARLLAGFEEIRASGELQGIPTIMVHGRADGLIPVNHSSRPYYAAHRQIGGADSSLYYYEIENAQHLDFLNPAYASADMDFVPIDYYFKSALELMYDHLVDGTTLPPSQVVPAEAPVDGVLTRENLAPITAEPVKPIVYEAGVLTFPE